MGKKDKKKKEKLEPQKMAGGTPGRPFSPVGRKGWKIIFGGIFILFIGFIVLSLADARGDNWASTLAPFLIILGYALIGMGIITKNPA